MARSEAAPHHGVALHWRGRHLCAPFAGAMVAWAIQRLWTLAFHFPLLCRRGGSRSLREHRHGARVAYASLG